MAAGKDIIIYALLATLVIILILIALIGFGLVGAGATEQGDEGFVNNLKNTFSNLGGGSGNGGTNGNGDWTCGTDYYYCSC